MLEFDVENTQFAQIKVVGVGGAGNNAINRMIQAGLKGVEYIAVNTDKQQLFATKSNIKIQIGEKLTKGLGSGANPDVGQRAAEESKDELAQILKGADLCFIAAGMGGGTGTGAAPIIAEVAKSLGILTVGVITKPFSFEGSQRMKNAEAGLKLLKGHVDSLVTIPNDRLLQIADKKTTFTEALRIADDILRQGVQGVSDLITIPGLINVDFADVKTIMQERGLAHMGIGIGTGEDRAMTAVKQAIHSPLLETSIAGAKGVLLNFTGSSNLGIFEIYEAAELVKQAADPGVNLIFGSVIDDNMDNEVRITVIATGFDSEHSTNHKPTAKGKIDKADVKQMADSDNGPFVPDFLKNWKR